MLSLTKSERRPPQGVRIVTTIAVQLLLLVAPWLAVADAGGGPPPPQVDMGANLAAMRDWSSQLAFQDVFKMSRRLRTDWNENFIDQIPQDADGYPLEIPYTVDGTSQTVFTIMYRDIDGHYPAGRYVCLYDGIGTLDIDFDADNAERIAPGRYEFDVPNPSDGGIRLTITSSHNGDHVRNIRVFHEQLFDDTYATQVWNPDFIANLQSFNVQSIRFMDWQGGNKPDPQTWGDRSTSTFQTQTTRKGVAVEHMVDLCNQMGVSPWFSMPYLNGDDYYMQFATYVRDNLDPSLTIYLEWGNEAWNGAFRIYDWIEDNKPAGLNHPEGNAYFADNLFSIWMTVFAGEESRIDRVVGGFSGSPGQLQQALDWIFANGGGCDAGAIAQYIYADFSVVTPDSTIDELKASMIQIITEDLPDRLENKSHCDTYGIPLLAYEGGQHLQPPDSAYLPLVLAMQTDPAIYDVYESLFEQWKYDVGGGLWNCYSYCNRWSDSGFWGHLEYLDDELANAPKWQALVDFSVPTQCPADINSDGVVDLLDLIDLLVCFGLPAVPGCEDEDINGDGTVNVLDLIQLLLAFETACPA